MFIYQLLMFALVGGLAGFLAGLFGIGGGIIVVPSMFYIMNFFYGENAGSMQLCVATSLASMIVTTFFSMMAHRSKKGVKWNLIKSMSFGVFIGSLFGVLSARYFQSDVLECIFGFFLIFNSMSFIFNKDHHHQRLKSDYKEPKTLITFGASTLISYLSSILGIGGGVFSIQFFSWIRLGIHQSIGTASAISFCVSLCSTFFYLVFQKNQVFLSNDINFLVGPIYLPAFFSVSIFSALMAPYGVKSIYKIKTSAAKRLFGFLLLVVGSHMIIRIFK